MDKEKNIFRKIFRRVIWENLSTAIILIGVFMLLQPFQMLLYTYSFIVILIGTIGFVITSHFPD
jgi:hypothetical protein